MGTTVNGKKVNIPSYLVNEGDVIAVKETSKNQINLSRLLKQLLASHTTMVRSRCRKSC